MSIAKKKRSDRKLNALTPEQELQLCEAMLSGVPYHKCLVMVRKDFGIECGKTALEDFYQDVCVPELLSRQQRARLGAQAIEAEAKKRPGEWDEATTAAVQQLAFDTVTRGGSADEVAMVVDLVLKMRGQALEKEKLSLAKAKWEFDAAKSALDAVKELKEIAAESGLGTDEKIQKARVRLFGKAVGS